VWVVESTSDALLRLDPSTSEATAGLDAGEGLRGLTFEDGALWVAGFFDESVSRIDPSTGDVTATFTVFGSPVDLAVGDDRVWVAADDKVLSVDLSSGEVDVAAAGGMDGPSPVAVAVGEGAVWATVLD
jgi:streptogramin lyase